jgi:myo-inositol-1-phosphate synthase
MPDGSLQRSGINVAIVGVGNCASSLVQGIALYREDEGNEHTGLMHWDLGGYRPGDIGRDGLGHRPAQGRADVAQAIFERPNCTAVFCPQVPADGSGRADGPRP